MPAFLAIALITIGGTTFLTVGSAIGLALSIGLSLAANYLAQQQAKKAKKDVQGVGDPGFQGTTRGAIVPQRVIYGHAFAGGAVFFEKVKPPYYTVGLLIAAHEIDAIEEVRINNVPVVMDAAGNVLTSPFFTDDGRTLAKISIRLGTADQAADPLILARYPEVGAGFRQRGHATIALEAHYGASRDEFEKVWAGQAPQLTMRIRGKKIYNPLDPTQQQDDPSTWKWSSSPSLCWADFLRSPWGGRVPSSKFRWDRIAKAAEIDLQQVPTRSGIWEQRYSCDGIIDTSAPAIDAIRGILTCNRGIMSWIADGYTVDAGAPRQPCFTIHEKLLVGGVEYRADTPRSELVNVVRTRFVAPDRDYQIVDGPILERTDLIASDGARYEQTLDMIMVEGSARAQRLAKAYLEDGRLSRTVQLTLDVEAIALEPGDIVKVDLPSLMTDDLDGLYEVQSISFTEAFTALAVTLVETSPDIYQFDPTVDEQFFAFEEAE